MTDRHMKSRKLAFEDLDVERKRNLGKQHRSWSEGQRISAEKHLKKELSRNAEELSEQNLKSEYNSGSTGHYPIYDYASHELRDVGNDSAAPERRLSRLPGGAASSADLDCQHFSRCHFLAFFSTPVALPFDFLLPNRLLYFETKFVKVSGLRLEHCPGPAPCTPRGYELFCTTGHT